MNNRRLSVRQLRPYGFGMLLLILGGLLGGCQALNLLTHSASHGLPPQTEEAAHE